MRRPRLPPLRYARSRPAGRRACADEIARRVQNRDTGRDHPGAARSAPDGDRLLIRFTYPNDIRGTGVLVWEHPSSEDERFLFLPSLGRVRRIAGSEAQESFVGSDFTYEDIGGRGYHWTVVRS